MFFSCAHLNFVWCMTESSVHHFFHSFGEAWSPTLFAYLTSKSTDRFVHLNESGLIVVALFFHKKRSLLKMRNVDWNVYLKM